MANLATWVCEECGQSTDLTKTPFKETLVKDLDTALQIDLQAKERGETITRLGFRAPHERRNDAFLERTHP